jgi:hypothetical protein
MIRNDGIPPELAILYYYVTKRLRKYYKSI